MSSTRVPEVGAFRTKGHGYYMDGKGPYPGATGVIDVLDKSGPLVGWAKRITAEFAVDNLTWATQTMELVGRDATVAAIKSKAKAEKDAGMELGAKIHYLIEDVGRGKSRELSPQHAPYIAAYRQWIEDFSPELVSLEHYVFNLTEGYAGTFDILARIDGELWLIDAKTNKGSTYNGIYTGVYPETALQLAAYGNAEFIGVEGESKRYRFPKIKHFGVLHLRPDAPYEKGYRFYRYHVTPAEFAAFRACLALYRWRLGREKEVVGESVGMKIRKEAA